PPACIRSGRRPGGQRGRGPPRGRPFVWGGCLRPPRPRRSRAQARSGVAAVELAVLAPFLAFLFVIAIDWSRVFYFSLVVDNCARNGALWAFDQYNGINSPYKNVT